MKPAERNTEAVSGIALPRLLRLLALTAAAIFVISLPASAQMLIALAHQLAH